MKDARIDLPWWPPDPDEPIGGARALELVAALRRIAGPVVAEAEAAVRARAGHPIEVRRYAEPVQLFATWRLTAEMQSLCVGVVSQANANPAASSSLQLGRDGRLRWRRDRYPHSRWTPHEGSHPAEFSDRHKTADPGVPEPAA